MFLLDLANNNDNDTDNDNSNATTAGDSQVVKLTCILCKA